MLPCKTLQCAQRTVYSVPMTQSTASPSAMLDSAGQDLPKTPVQMIEAAWVSTVVFQRIPDRGCNIRYP